MAPICSADQEVVSRISHSLNQKCSLMPSPRKARSDTVALREQSVDQKTNHQINCRQWVLEAIRNAVSFRLFLYAILQAPG